MPSPVVGPNGVLIDGKPLFEGDRGGINVGFGILNDQRLCYYKFGTAVSVLTITPDEAKTVITQMRQAITHHWGKLKYNVEELPIKVSPFENRLVMIVLPSAIEILLANPELFLALAQRMEETVSEIFVQ